jgi:hypothetical protein
MAKGFEKNTLPGGRSVILLKSKQNRVQLGELGGQSAGPKRTVRGVLADGPPGPTASSPSR